MPAKAGIQDFEKLNKIKNWIPASAGMTALFSNYDTVSGCVKDLPLALAILFHHCWGKVLSKK